MQVNDNLIRNSDKSNMNIIIEDTLKRGDNAVEDFKSSMQIRIAENDKKLNIEKKPTEKAKPTVNLKPSDNKDKKSYKVDDVTYSKAVSANALNTNNSSDVKTDNTVLNDETKVLAANAILSTDNLVKNMLVVTDIEGVSLTTAAEEINISNEKSDVFVESSFIEELENSDIEENKNQSEETGIKIDVKKPENTDSDRAVVKNSYENPNGITAKVERNTGLFKEIVHTANENTEANRNSDANTDNMVNFEIKSDEAAGQYGFAGESDEKNLSESEKEEKAEFDFTDKIAGTNNHKNTKPIVEDINTADPVDGFSNDNELRIQIIEQIADYMDAYAVAKKDTLELMLNPENLGKLMMQVKQTSSGVAVSILCETQKTYHLLKERTGEIAAILDKKLQDPVTVNVQSENKQDYLNQNNKENSKDAFYEQQSRQQEEKQKRQAANEATSFLSRLRLGIN